MELTRYLGDVCIERKIIRGYQGTFLTMVMHAAQLQPPHNAPHPNPAFARRGCVGKQLCVPMVSLGGVRFVGTAKTLF